MFRFTNSLFTVLIIISTSLSPIYVNAQDKKDEAVEFSKCWTYAEAETGFSVIATDATTAYLSSAQAKIAAVSINSGVKLWSSELGGEIASNLTVGDAGIFVVTNSVSNDTTKPIESTLRTLSKETGITSKSTLLAAADSFKIAIDSSSVVIVSKSGDVYAFDSTTAAQKWVRKPTGGVAGEAYVGGGSIVIGTTDGKLLRLNSSTGEIDLTVGASSTPTVVRNTVDGQIVYGDSRGNVVAVDARWKFRSGAQISSIFEFNGGLIVTSFDNFIYCLTRDNGGVVWKKRMAGRIADMSFTSANTALIFTYGGDVAILAELKKGKTIGQIPLSQPSETVNIPDLTTENAIFISNGSIYSFATKPCNSENTPS